MENARLLVFDLDGTLLDSPQRLPRERIELLEKLRRAGIDSTLATGRPYVSAAPFAEQLAVRVPMILFNGAALSTASGETIWIEKLPRQVALDALRLASRIPVASHLYFEPRDPWFHTDRDGEARRHMMAKDGMESRRVEDLCTLIDQEKRDPIKLFFIGPRQDLEWLRKEFRALHDTPTCVFSENEMLEILAPGVSKGAALDRLRDAIGIPPEAMVAFGDNMNDLTMLRRAGTGIAMAQAPQALRDAADLVTGDLDRTLRALLRGKGRIL